MWTMTGQKVSTRVKARCEPPSRGFAWRAVRERPAKEGNTARPAMELSASKTESRLVGGSRPPSILHIHTPTGGRRYELHMEMRPKMRADGKKK